MAPLHGRSLYILCVNGCPAVSECNDIYLFLCVCEDDNKEGQALD